MSLPLVSSDELADHMQRPVDAASAFSAIRVAEGWLRGATRLSEWPDPVPDDLWAWAVELAAIAYDNPTGLVSQTIGSESYSWAMARKSEITVAARQRYGASDAPVYAFPPAVPWPC